MSARVTEAMVEAGAAPILDILNTAALAFPTDPAAKHLAMRLSRACLAAALSTEPGEAEGWQPIETAPFDKLVDLWCIQGYEREATWPVRGSLVGGRHKTKDYGWFGNQSKDGVPQKDAPDLVPVAWRPVNVPTDLVAKLREALKPFATARGHFDGHVRDEDTVDIALRHIRAHHVRAAARVLSEREGQDG